MLKVRSTVIFLILAKICTFVLYLKYIKLLPPPDFWHPLVFCVGVKLGLSH